jgi:nucleoside-diphosphate-sugar epimerase
MKGINLICPSRKNLEQELQNLKQLEFFIHCAGKAHSINKSIEEEQGFFDSNVELTKRLTTIISENSIRVDTFVFISSVAVYGVEEGWDIDEKFPLRGQTAYARSKILAELQLTDWAKINGVNLVILRLPLIFGENAPGNLGAMERAIKGRYYFQIGKGNARRSMVHVKQLAEFLPTLTGKSGVYHLTDGKHNSYNEVAKHFAKKHNRRIINVPYMPIMLLAKLGNVIPKFPLNSYRLAKLNQTLTFNDERARKELGWNGTNALEV